MKKWLLICSVDGIDIDHEQVITSETEPGFWECYEIAEDHGCDFFTVDELREEDIA